MNGVRAVFAATGLLCLPAAFAGAINFETGASCSFSSELTTLYSGQGVTFAGPSAGSGGGIVDQCAHFGIAAHSGTDILAFNLLASYGAGGAPIGPESITFSSLVSNVSLFVGSTQTGPAYTLLAFDSGANQIGSASGTPAGGQWVQLSINTSNISSLQLSFTSNAAVVDDLSWNGSVATTPEPSAPVPLTLCLAAIAGTIAGRRPRC